MQPHPYYGHQFSDSNLHFVLFGVVIYIYNVVFGIGNCYKCFQFYFGLRGLPLK